MRRPTACLLSLLFSDPWHAQIVPPPAPTVCNFVQIAVSLATHAEALPAGLVHSVKVRIPGILVLLQLEWPADLCRCAAAACRRQQE